jgi:hypothetical protein
LCLYGEIDCQRKLNWLAFSNFKKLFRLMEASGVCALRFGLASVTSRS